MRTTLTSILLGVIGIYLMAPIVAAIGQEKETDGPTGLEGSWLWVKSKDGAGEWVDHSTGDPREIKHITRTHFFYFHMNPESKQVSRGAGGHCTIKGDSFKETYTYYISDDDKVTLGREINYTWHFKGQELHLSWSDGKQENKQVWRRLPK